jgi:endonuclease III
MSDLPRPVTTADKYLAALLDELKAIHDELVKPEPQPEEEETVELREVEEVVLTDLPQDFPGYDALTEAGIIYLETVPRNGDELVEIPGIGKATANKILTWFKT